MTFVINHIRMVVLNAHGNRLSPKNLYNLIIVRSLVVYPEAEIEKTLKWPWVKI